MATHSSVLAWRVPGTEEPGGLLSLGSQSWTRLTRLSSSSSSISAEIYICNDFLNIISSEKIETTIKVPPRGHECINFCKSIQ